MHEKRGVTTVVQNHVGALVTRRRPVKNLLGAPPVLLQCLALPGKDGSALRVVGGSQSHDDSRSGFVLGGKDVAARPAHLRTECDEGFDEHRGLHGHVQRAGDTRAFERLVGSELFTEGHEPGHLVFGETNLVAAGLCEGQIGNAVLNGGSCQHGL